MILFSLIIFSPLIYFSFYNVPNLEDISLSIVWEYENVWHYIKELYISFDGRYGTNFIHYFNPLSFKFIEGYKFLSLISISLLISALSLFIKNILKLKSVEYNSNLQILISATFIAACFFSWIFSMPHILYWFGSALVYLYPIIFFLFSSSFFLQIQFCKSQFTKLLFLILSALMLFVGIGLSELSLFFFNIFILLFIIYNYIKKGEISMELKLIIIVLILSNILFLSAPGIWLRKEMFAEGVQDTSLILLLKNLIFHNFLFLLSTLVPSVFCVLVLNLYWSDKIELRTIETKKTLSFFIVVVVVISFTSLAYYIPSGFFSYFPNRIFNSLWGYYLIMFIFIFYPLINKISSKIKYSVMFTCLVLIFVNPRKSIQQSINLLKNKSYITHHKNYMKRVDCLKFCAKKGIEVVYVKPFETNKNLIINPPNLMPNRKEPYWNEALQDYFGIEHVLLVGDTIKI